MIKNIIFDMGNVLIFFRPLEYVARLELDGRDSELLLENVFHADEWLHLDDGSMNEEEVIKSVCKRVPERLHEGVRKLVCEWYRPLLPVPGMENLVKELKEDGYKLYLLSNAGTNQHNYWEDIPGSQYFEGTLISADVKEVKPDKAIYQILFRKFNLQPEESVFIDDNENNINAGIDLGMKGIVFKGDAKVLREELKTILGK